MLMVRQAYNIPFFFFFYVHSTARPRNKLLFRDTASACVIVGRIIFLSRTLTRVWFSDCFENGCMGLYVLLYSCRGGAAVVYIFYTKARLTANVFIIRKSRQLYSLRSRPSPHPDVLHMTEVSARGSIVRRIRMSRRGWRTINHA